MDDLDDKDLNDKRRNMQFSGFQVNYAINILSQHPDNGLHSGQITEILRFLLKENVYLKQRIETLEHQIENHRFA